MNFISVACDFGKQRNKITFRFGTKPLHILPDVFFLPFPRPLSPAHAHEEKYGWLARLHVHMAHVYMCTCLNVYTYTCIHVYVYKCTCLPSGAYEPPKAARSVQLRTIAQNGV